MYSEIPAVPFLPCIRTEILFGSIFPAHNENSKYGLWKRPTQPASLNLTGSSLRAKRRAQGTTDRRSQATATYSPASD